MARKIEKLGFFSYLGIIIMIIGLLFAGSEAESQERQFSDPFHLGNIQELGTDANSQIELLKEDREYYLNRQRSFEKKGDKQAYLWATKILQKIEMDLKKIRSKN